MTGPDLSLVPVDELCDEIVKRGDAAIVFVSGLSKDGKGYVNWGGDYYKALGLCFAMQTCIQADSSDDLV